MPLIKPYAYLNAEFDKSDIRIIHVPHSRKKDLPLAIISIADLSTKLPPEETQAIAAA